MCPQVRGWGWSCLTKVLTLLPPLFPNPRSRPPRRARARVPSGSSSKPGARAGKGCPSERRAPSAPSLRGGGPGRVEQGAGALQARRAPVPAFPAAHRWPPRRGSSSRAPPPRALPGAPAAAPAAHPAAWPPLPPRHQTFPGAGAGESQRGAGLGGSGAAAAGRGSALTKLGSGQPCRAAGTPGAGGLRWARLGTLATRMAWGGWRSAARSGASLPSPHCGPSTRRADTFSLPGLGQGARPERLSLGSGAQRGSLVFFEPPQGLNLLLTVVPAHRLSAFSVPGFGHPLSVAILLYSFTEEKTEARSGRKSCAQEHQLVKGRESRFCSESSSVKSLDFMR